MKSVSERSKIHSKFLKSIANVSIYAIESNMRSKFRARERLSEFHDVKILILNLF